MKKNVGIIYLIGIAFIIFIFVLFLKTITHKNTIKTKEGVEQKTETLKSKEQIIQKIKSNSIKIEENIRCRDNRRNNSSFHSDIDIDILNSNEETFLQECFQFCEINNILNLNLFNYNNLRRYDTELKVKFFKKSDDYKRKYENLKKRKEELLTTNYYIDFKPKTSLFQPFKYDLSSKTFSITNRIDKEDSYNKLGYVQFDKIAIKCPKGVYLKKTFLVSNKKENKYNDFIKHRRLSKSDAIYLEKIRKEAKESWRQLYVSNKISNSSKESDVNSTCMYYNTKQIISFKIEDEETALKIEENRDFLRILFIFRIKERVKNKVLLVANKTKIIFYNYKTNEIYYTFN